MTGKTTYCKGMQMYMRTIGRDCDIVNLDFANDLIPYQPAADVRDVPGMKIDEVMVRLKLTTCLKCCIAPVSMMIMWMWI